MNLLISPIVKFPVCHLNVAHNSDQESFNHDTLREKAINLIGASTPNDYIIIGQKVRSHKGMTDARV